MLYILYDFLRYDYTVKETEQHLHEAIKSKCTDKHAPLVFEALNIVHKLYDDQQRDDLVPAILHPMRVALMLVQLDANATSKLLIAALLHDVIKDGYLTGEEIEKKFGHYVAKLVTAITDYALNSCIGDTRQPALPQTWQAILFESHEIRSIKVFEALDNMVYWKIIPADHQLRNDIPCWLEEARVVYLPLAHATNMQAYDLMRREYEYYVEHGYAHH